MDIETIIWLCVMITTVLGTLSYASFRALSLEKFFFKMNTPTDQIQIDWKTALSFPVFASCALLGFFYFFHLFSILFTLSICFSATFSLSFLFYPLFFPQSEAYYQFFLNDNICANSNLRNPRFLTVLVLSVTVLICWFITGSAVLNNVMGISFCVVGICLMRIPNVKIGSIILFSLFFYDIFWVFYSQPLFGQNVMVHVAQQQATNPAATLASKLNFGELFTPVLDLPVKLIFGHSMIGLGDIVIPGLFVSYCLKFDAFRHKREALKAQLPFFQEPQKTDGSWETHSVPSSPSSSSPADLLSQSVMKEGEGIPQMKKRKAVYFLFSFCGYGVGLAVTIYVAFYLGLAQPALLYLVPCTLVPVFMYSYRIGEFQMFWNGFEIEEIVVTEIHEQDDVVHGQNHSSYMKALSPFSSTQKVRTSDEEQDHHDLENQIL